jgi:hypothetical protein
MVSFPASPLIVLGAFAPVQSMVSFPEVPVTFVVVCVTPALTTQAELGALRESSGAGVGAVQPTAPVAAHVRVVTGFSSPPSPVGESA